MASILSQPEKQIFWYIFENYQRAQILCIISSHDPRAKKKNPNQFCFYSDASKVCINYRSILNFENSYCISFPIYSHFLEFCTIYYLLTNQSILRSMRSIFIFHIYDLQCCNKNAWLLSIFFFFLYTPSLWYYL